MDSIVVGFAADGSLQYDLTALNALLADPQGALVDTMISGSGRVRDLDQANDFEWRMQA